MIYGAKPMAIAKRHYPILLGEKGELDAVETDNAVRNTLMAVFALQEDVTLMQEKVGGALRRGEISEDDTASSVGKVANATRTIILNAPAPLTGVKLVSPTVNRLPFVNAALELDGGTNAPEYNSSTKALTIRGALNITGATTLSSTLAVTGATTLSSTAQIDGVVTVGDGGAEDQIVILNGNAQDYFIGIDDTDDTFQIGRGTAPGTTPAVTITTAGAISFAGAGTFDSTLVVTGTLGVTGTTTLDGIQIIDITAAEAFLVRVNSDGGDVFAVNTSTPGVIVTGTLVITGTTTTVGRIKNTTRKTTTYTILVTDDRVFGNTDSAGWTATLPAGVEGQSFNIINSGSSGNTLVIAPNGSEHLLGVNSNFSLADAETLELTYNATDGWY